MCTSPASWQRRATAALQGAGSSLVAGHSAHVFHGVEWSERGAVPFDLWDALDDYRVDPVGETISEYSRFGGRERKARSWSWWA